ncbi:efflux RND transporter permease subunit [Beijerinckia sp. L45]|uniref:efflux RND transporter permease subunit n=1 Tax=Beijerinckia sp. L45 TaxID=1641855 RepID=UPI00131D8806|nr:efflux RND transporter permease subunit [Beijerinckia sp. L45]
MTSFTDLFIRRPVLASVVSLLILFVGLQAFSKLQIRQYPELSSTSITVTTTYPGANADLIKGFITTPIAQAVASAEGIDTLVSNSQQNVSTITLNLRLNANADRAVADVLSKINQVKFQLPRESQDPIVIKKTGDSTALMYLSFNSTVLTPSQITDYLNRVVQPRLQTIDGVASADILGGQTFAMRVWLDPNRMAARGVTAADVRNALAVNNFTSAAGQVKSDFTQTSINALTSLDSARAFGQLVVANHGDALIRIADIATTELGPESVDSSSVFDGEKAVFIGINSTPTANPLEVITAVRAAFPALQSDLPAGLTASIAYDATKFIRASILEVEKTLAEAALIVVIVIFLFLGNFRSTIIPIVTIPLSLVGVMIMLLMLGYSINLLTLLALVLAIGLVVDDAIVVVENIYRHMEEGMTPHDAAIKGAREITGPVISMTITLAAVYAPIGFVSGLTGALFREFAFTLAGSVVVSGVVALTLTPMMCAKLLKPPPPEGAGGFTAFLDRRFDWLRRSYERRLVRSLNFRALTLLVLAGVLGLTAIMFMTTPKELAPEEDQGVIFALIKAPQYGNLDYIEQSTKKLHDFVADMPEFDHLFAINGFQGVQSGFGGIILKNWGDRTRSQKQVLQALAPKFGQITGAQVIGFSPPALPGSTGGPPLQFVVRSIGDYKDIVDVMAKIQDAARKSGLFIFTDSDLKFDTPQIEFKVDADKANRLGISMQDVGSTLATLLGGNYVNRFNLYGRSYEVIPQVPREFRLTSDWLTRYQMRTAGGDLVPLATIASVSESTQPNSLPTFQQLNSATLQGVPFPGRTLGEALDFLNVEAKKVMPEGFTIDYQGESRQYIQEGNTLVLTFVFALIVIYLVLAAQFESFRDPFIILIALPTSMFGALLPLNLLGVLGMASMNIYSQIGLVTLIGLISKHGILMVEFANRLQEEGMDRRRAIEHAAGVRLRPILMTTAAMVVAMVPLMVAEGAGARSRFAIGIGIVIAFGMAVGTLFTLFVTPAIYTLVARDHGRGRAVEHEPTFATARAAE